MKKRTRVTHLPDVPLAPDNRPLVAPLHQSVKFTFGSVAETRRLWAGERDGFYYSRVSNPTLRQLEIALAELQGRDGCLLTGSGVAAISMTLLALLEAGDHVVFFAESYPPTREIVQRILGRYGVASTMLSIDDLGSLERTLSSRPTRLVVFESPTNPVLKIADLGRAPQPRAVRRRPVRAQPDQVRVRARRRDGRRGDRQERTRRGDAPGLRRPRTDARPARGLAHPARAQDLLRALGLPVPECVARRRIPGGASCRGPRALSGPRAGSRPCACSGADGRLRHDRDVRRARRPGGWHSFRRSASPPAMQQPRGFTAEQAAWSDIGPGTVRLSVGIEDEGDLLDDLQQALRVV